MLFLIENRFLIFFPFLKLMVASVFGLSVLVGRSNQVVEAVISGQELSVASFWFIILLGMNLLNKLGSFITYDRECLTISTLRFIKWENKLWCQITTLQYINNAYKIFFWNSVYSSMSLLFHIWKDNFLYIKIDV